jgi:hypothetical protein
MRLKKNLIFTKKQKAVFSGYFNWQPCWWTINQIILDSMWKRLKKNTKIRNITTWVGKGWILTLILYLIERALCIPEVAAEEQLHQILNFFLKLCRGVRFWLNGSAFPHPPDAYSRCNGVIPGTNHMQRAMEHSHFSYALLQYTYMRAAARWCARLCAPCVHPIKPGYLSLNIRLT